MGGGMMLHEWIDPAELDQRLDVYRYSPIFTDALKTLRKCPHPIVKLQDIQEPGVPISYGILQPRAFLTEGGIPMVRAVDLTNPFIETEKVVCVPPTVEKAYKRSRIKSEDVLVSIAGTLGAIGITPYGWSTANINQSVARIRVVQPHDPYFLATYLMSSVGQLLLDREAVGSVQRHLNLEDIPSVKLPLLKPTIQHAIGNKVRKAQRLREIARNIQIQMNHEVTKLYGNLSVNNGIDIPRWVEHSDLSEGRLDSWFYRTLYLNLSHLLCNKSGLVRVGELCKLSSEVALLPSWPSEDFFYFEIGGVDPETGDAVPELLKCYDAPSRAKYLTKPDDLLISTVRPNLKAVALVPDEYDAAVCSSGFSVLRCREPETAAYIRACLTHDIATHQLMRWNTGATYPAIDRSVPLQVLIPHPGEDRIREIGQQLIQASQNNRSSKILIRQAKADIEALIDGILDEEQLLSEGEEIARWLDANPCPREQEHKV
jgi:type I restriction enzyme, S subunit